MFIGAFPGSYVDILVPKVEETGPLEGNNHESPFCMKKSTVGAAVVGGALGALILGPVGAVLLAGAGAFASSDNGKVGKATRSAGSSTYGALSSTSSWIQKKYNHMNKLPGEEEVKVATAEVTNIPHSVDKT